MANPPGVPSSYEEVYSNNEIFREIEEYTAEAEREEQIQAGDPLFYVLASDVWWSKGASSSGGTGPSTSGAPLQTLTPNASVRTRCLGVPPRDWDSFLVNIG